MKRMAILLLCLVPLTSLAQTRPASAKEMMLVRSVLEGFLKAQTPIELRDVRAAPTEVQGANAFCGEVLAATGPLQPVQFQKFMVMGGQDETGRDVFLVAGIGDTNGSQATSSCQKYGM